MQILKSIIPIIIILQNFFAYANHKENNNQLSNPLDTYFTQCTEGVHDKDHLLVDCYSLEPYQFSHVTKSGHHNITGLDIELINAISSKINIGIQYTDSAWEQVIPNIQQGKSDMVPGLTYTEERAAFANFSIPYRLAEISLFTLRSARKHLHFNNTNEFLAQIRLLNFRLGITRKAVYGNTRTTEYLNQASNNDIIIKYGSNAELFKGLLRNEIDGVLADRIAGVALTLNYIEKDQIEEIPTRIKTPVHLMFSKKTVSPNLVARFNNSIKEFINSDEYKKIVERYKYNILLLKSIDSSWCYIIGVIGSIAFAISGIIISAKTNATLFITFVLAMLPSLLGCILLDIVVRSVNVSLILTPYYTCRIFITVLIGFFAIKLLAYYNKQLYEDDFIQKIRNNTLIVCDSLGQASFMIIGVITVIVQKIEPLEFWGPCFACLTSSVGIIFRNLICQHDKNIESIPREINFEILILWGAIFSILLDSYAYKHDYSTIKYSIITVFVGAFVSRLLVYYYNIPNLTFRSDNTEILTKNIHTN
ncbi:transporter substrate-binding domain-containing protein [Rickettsia endosymbiont of Oedothorax gibbosus]|uniref:transporter substrate-binding domain-containing protein n=1 Tax=Rickettsia endosymbiont of Oedothorax gibbosus TaxID=931099 RepID=UPI002025B022|nr:transporter substrate-binding domain-containing protein [Rickettsia endosymbiont of Oedothorax gibbosus]